MYTEQSTCAVCGGGIGPDEIIFGEMNEQGAKYHQDCLPSHMKPCVLGDVKQSDGA